MESVSYCDHACLMEVNQGTIFHAKILHFIDHSELSKKITLLPDVTFVCTEHFDMMKLILDVEFKHFQNYITRTEDLCKVVKHFILCSQQLP